MPKQRDRRSNHRMRALAVLAVITLSACAKEAATVQTLPGSRIVVSHTFHW
jgi:hypothetical protein